MALDLQQVRYRTADVLGGFTLGQKVMTVVTVAAIVVGGLMFTRWASQPSYGPLFTNLESSDAAAVTEALGTRGVPYQLGDGGRTILVPQERLYQLRLDMSAEGLPSGGTVGYALLDQQGITTSEFRQRVDYKRALEGELARTIGAIEGVEVATVHLVIPERDVFSADDRKATASVLVRTRAGATLAAGQVQAVVHLVASSVEGLNPTDVTVADGKGTVLSAGGEDGMAAAAGDARTQQTRAFEDNLATSVQDMLTQLVGPGRAVVRVKADLDFDQRATTTERFEQPDPAFALTENTAREVPIGVLGPEGAPAGAESTTEYEREEAQRTFAAGKVTEQVKSAPGAVNRLSVAVLLDETVGLAGDPQEIEDLVIAATGADLARGDTVEVGRMPFDVRAAEEAQAALEAEEAARERDQLMGLVRTGVAVLIVLVVLFLAWRSMRKAAAMRGPRTVPIDLNELPTSTVDDLVLDEDLTEMLASSENLERRRKTEEFSELVEQQPLEVAQMLRGWLADRRS
jgi:flagellar M-ring protein FliF